MERRDINESDIILPTGDVIRSNVDLVALGQKIGSDAYQMAKQEWRWSEKKALQWKEIWGSPIPPPKKFF